MQTFNVSRKTKIIISSVVGVLGPAMIVYAVVQSLNSVTGQNQTFVNDSNVKITSSTTTNTHTIGWNGALPVSRGGTGATTFTTGSIPFFDGTRFSENNPGLFYDAANQALTLGGGLTTGSDVEIQNNSQLHFFTGAASAANPTFSIGEGGVAGRVEMGGPSTGIFDFNSLENGGIYTFPNQTGMFAVLEGAQTFSGFKKFISAATSTVQIGDATKTACLAMGDSDGVGITYITANDGVLTATTTQPIHCQ